jgi:hypothetical protein
MSKKIGIALAIIGWFFVPLSIATVVAVGSCSWERISTANDHTLFSCVRDYVMPNKQIPAKLDAMRATRGKT